MTILPRWCIRKGGFLTLSASVRGGFLTLLASVWGGFEGVFSPCLRLFGEVLRRVPSVDNTAVLVHQKSQVFPSLRSEHYFGKPARQALHNLP